MKAQEMNAGSIVPHRGILLRGWRRKLRHPGYQLMAAIGSWLGFTEAVGCQEGHDCGRTKLP